MDDIPLQSKDNGLKLEFDNELLPRLQMIPTEANHPPYAKYNRYSDFPILFLSDSHIELPEELQFLPLTIPL